MSPRPGARRAPVPVNTVLVNTVLVNTVLANTVLANTALANAAGEDSGAFEVTDEMIARLLANPFSGRRRPKLRLVPLIPVAHGFAALATFMLATLAAINATLGTFQDQ